MLTSIDDLANAIYSQFSDGKKLKDMTDTLKLYSGTDWLYHVVITDCSYYRKCVISNDYFEIYVMTWNRNKESKIHDHPENGCLLKVLRGILIEEIYEKNEDGYYCKSKHDLNINDIGYQEGKTGLHKIINLDGLSATLHIYSPPKYVPKCY